MSSITSVSVVIERLCSDLCKSSMRVQHLRGRLRKKLRNCCPEFHVRILLLVHLFLRSCDILWIFWLTYSRELNHASGSFLLLFTLSHSYYTLDKSLNEMAAVMCLLPAIKVHRLYLNLAALIFLNSWLWLELFQTIAEALFF